MKSLADDTFLGLWQSETTEVNGQNLATDPSLPGIPEWLRGTFFVAGPHGMDIGGREFKHYLDGFGRMLSFKFGKEGVCFSARMIPSKYYNKSTEEGERVPVLAFDDTSPEQDFSFFEKLPGPVDNTYVQQHDFAGELWGCTDSQETWSYSSDLRHWSAVDWDDSLVKFLRQPASVSHAVVETSGRMVGLMTQTALLPWDTNYMTLYAVEPDAHHHRKELATWEVPKAPYQHSFGLGNGKAIVAAHPWYLDNEKLVNGQGILNAMNVGVGAGALDSKTLPPDEVTTYYLADLETGNVESFVGEPYLFFHFINVFETELGDIVFDAPAWTGNGYQIFSIPNCLEKKAWRDGFRSRCSNTFRRFTLHRSGALKGKVTSELLDDGWLEYPQFNWDWRGRESKYTYMVEWYHGSDSYADMAVVKFDSNAKERVSEWAEPGHFPMEPKFVARPGGSEEDDGVLLTLVFDGAKGSSYLLVLDARSFQPLDRIDIGLRVPTTVHGVFRFEHPG